MKTRRRLNKRKPHKYKKTVKFGGKPWAREGNRWVKSFAIPPPVPPKMVLNEPVYKSVNKVKKTGVVNTSPRNSFSGASPSYESLEASHSTVESLFAENPYVSSESPYSSPTFAEPTIVEPTIVEPTFVEPTIVEPISTKKLTPKEYNKLFKVMSKGNLMKKGILNRKVDDEKLNYVCTMYDSFDEPIQAKLKAKFIERYNKLKNQNTKKSIEACYNQLNPHYGDLPITYPQLPEEPLYASSHTYQNLPNGGKKRTKKKKKRINQI
jgi:hypothetical protein